jgi:hypothetical protein
MISRRRPIIRHVASAQATSFHTATEWRNLPHRNQRSLASRAHARRAIYMASCFRRLGNAEPGAEKSGAMHEWNMVAPRCAVAGKWTITKRGAANEAHEFNGTGYHDHNRDNRFLPATIAEWQWGRAHFQNSTVVYYRYRELDAPPVTRLLVVENDELKIYSPRYTQDAVRRHHFGLSYPRRLGFAVDAANEEEKITLHADQTRVVDGSFFYLRFAGSAKLHRSNDRAAESATLISEYLAPRALRWRWLDWLINMRISRDNRPSFLK